MENKLTVTKEFQWDCAHCLNNKEKSEEENKKIFGPCFNIHGHTYKMFVTVSSLKFYDGSNHIENGMIINFVDLKRIVNELVVKRFDHKLLNEDELYQNKETTCENQIQDIWNILEEPLKNEGVQLEEIKLYETPTSYATLKR